MEDVHSVLQRAREKDTPFTSILGSMCTIPHEIAQQTYSLFQETNLGDNALFVGTRDLEDRAISWIQQLVHAPESSAGTLTSGGTESNITALWLFRELSGKFEFIVPEQAHFSFVKAASLLGMKLRTVDCQYRMHAQDVKKHLSQNTSCVVGIAGNTPFGYIDEIVNIAELCNDEHVFFHIDAAFGGFVAPFMSDVIIDFRAPISSISLDAHKMGMACIPCGFFILKKKEWFERIKVRSRCTHSQFQTSILGTRPGASAAAAFAVMHHLGFEGYKDVVQRCMATTYYLIKLLQNAGISYVPPELNLVAIKTECPNIIAEKLAVRGWFVGIDETYGIIRVVCMPHISRDMINKFVADLQEVIA